MEMKLALVLTIRELDFLFDWEGQDKLQGGSKTSDSVNGEHIYRVGKGIGEIKCGLPTRVKLRSKQA
ncbi:hypothetical protein JX266_002405 [Neoarthrinium moseri]|nr:hypothetical protein JX266_002405 [Neoarthrinium moseri]